MKLIFIYNVNSGFINSIIDNSHKILSPKTYRCNLCTLTHGSFKENQLWKHFRATIKMEIKFYHKDEFEKEYTINVNYPSILKEEKQTVLELLTSKELNRLKSTEALILALKKLI